MILRVSVAILLFIESGMLGMLADQLFIPVLIMASAVFLFIRPLQWDVSLTVKILVPASLVGYFCFRAVSLDGIQLDRTDFVFPVWVTNSLGECFLIGQIFELIKKRSSRDGLLNFCMLAMACVVCACSRFATLTERSLLFLGSVTCITLICVVFQYSTRAFENEKLKKRHYTFRGSLISITMVMVGFGSWYLSGFLKDNIEGFQEWWMRNVSNQITGFATTDIKYSQSATLENITNLKKNNPLNPVLHIHTDSIPGYLRNATFVRFNGSGWSRMGRRRMSVIDSVPAPAELESPDLQVFPVKRDVRATKYKKVRIENIDSQYLFIPLDADFLTGDINGSRSDNQLFVNSDGTVRNLNPSEDYVGFVGNSPAKATLSPSAATMLTQNYSALDPEIPVLARQITQSATNDSQRIASIESYFADNYAYSLDQKKFPEDRDRLSYFILERPAAHCEFFGSAAVVMLRANGIPARYVTGFAADERSTEEDYFIARNRDAHAWAEAFDRDRQEWVVVEATPGLSYPKNIWDNQDTAADDAGASDGDNESAGSRFQLSFFFQRIWIQIREFFEEIGRQLRGPLNIALTSLIIFGIVYRYWWKPRQNPLLRSRAGLLELQRRKVEQILARHRFVRKPNETMLRFERRVRSEVDAELEKSLEPIFQWLREYEWCRFGSDIDVESLPLIPQV